MKNKIYKLLFCIYFLLLTGCLENNPQNWNKVQANPFQNKSILEITIYEAFLDMTYTLERTLNGSSEMPPIRRQIQEYALNMYGPVGAKMYDSFTFPQNQVAIATMCIAHANPEKFPTFMSLSPPIPAECSRFLNNTKIITVKDTFVHFEQSLKP